MTVSVDIITDADRLDALSTEWNDLLTRSPANSIFLTWEWASAWLEAVRPGADIVVVCVRDGERLIGLAPLYRARMKMAGVMGLGCLRVLGDLYSGADYSDLIVDGNCAAEAGQAILATLVGEVKGWHCAWMPNVAGWTGAVDRLLGWSDSAGVRVRRRPRDFAALALPDSHDAYLKTISQKRRSQIRQQTRRVLESPDSGVDRCESVEQLPAMLDFLFDLHQMRWQSVGQAGSFTRKPLEREFYRRFAPVALGKGWLRLHALKHEGKVRAVQYGYVYNGTYHIMQEGFDPTAFEGIGNVLRNLVFKACIEEGVRHYDFLGGFTEHKRRWKAEHRTGYDLFLVRPGLKGLLLRAGVWPTGRYVKWEAAN